MQRSLIVILSVLLLFVAGCRQSEPISDEALAEIMGENSIDPDRLFYNIMPDIQWISPNPGNRWGAGGRELFIEGDVTKRITIKLDPKSESGKPFADAVADLTADDLEYAETEDGTAYARTIINGEHFIYRNFEDFIVTLIFVDLTSTVVDPIYIDDFEIIALEGGLNIME